MKTEGLRETLRQELVSARAETDRLFQMLAPQCIFHRPIPERHRIVFYLGHLEAFDWNMVAVHAFGMRSFHPQFDRLFEFGIDPVDGKLPDDQPRDWPNIDEIVSYNRRTRNAVDELLNGADFKNPTQPFVKDGLIFKVAIEHRLMHAETLAYMFHWLDYDLKRVPSLPRRSDALGHRARLNGASPSARIPSGKTTLGQDRDRGSFGWDNEFQSYSALVAEFSMDVFNVTNGDFLEFVLAGGYQQRSLWTDEAWSWIQESGIRHPKFWIERGDHWSQRTMFEEIPLPADWPVYVSHAEGSAYARWKGKALPTESQYHRAAFGSLDGSETPMPEGNFNFSSWSPDPVGATPGRASAFGIYDLVGNGWEWTSTPFAPFDGFEPFPFYRGYSADFFDGKHFVMKGASPRTAASLVRKSFRNWFQPHYPNVYATFRCVQ